MNKIILAALATGALLALGAGTSAHATIMVVGALSNFDVSNDTGKPEYEFDIEIPSVDPSTISSLWQNFSSYKGHDDHGTFGSDNAGGTLITYKNAVHAPGYTPPGFVEHFGIHFINPFFAPATTTYTWKDQNGVASELLLPAAKVTTVNNPNGTITVSQTVQNTTNHNLLVRFHAGTVADANNGAGLRLDNLVTTDAEVQRVEAEAEPGAAGSANGVLLQPGEVIGVDGEAHDPTDDIITNANGARDAFIAANHADALDAVLTNAGDSALSIASIFTVDGNGNPVTNIANFMQALNTVTTAATPVPEPATIAIFAAAAAAAAAMGSVRRARRS